MISLSVFDGSVCGWGTADNFLGDFLSQKCSVPHFLKLKIFGKVWKHDFWIIPLICRISKKLLSTKVAKSGDNPFCRSFQSFLFKKISYFSLQTFAGVCKEKEKCVQSRHRWEQFYFCKVLLWKYQTLFWRLRIFFWN